MGFVREGLKRVGDPDEIEATLDASGRNRGMRFQSSLAVGGAEFGLSSFGHNRRHIDCPYGMVGTAAAEPPISGKLR